MTVSMDDPRVAGLKAFAQASVDAELAREKANMEKMVLLYGEMRLDSDAKELERSIQGSTWSDETKRQLALQKIAEATKLLAEARDLMAGLQQEEGTQAMLTG
jgi:hypothetical protein